MRRLLLASAALCAFALAASAQEKTPAPPAPADDPRATYDDIKATLGMVPSFFLAFPPEAIAGAWEEMKAIQLATDTAIPNKYKELLGLAVSAQIPCKYCVYFHTQAARLHGATDAEIRHAIAEASLVRHWSTFVNGLPMEDKAFRDEIDRMVAAVKQAKGTPPEATPAEITDAASATADIQRTFGFMPTMFKAFPPRGLAGAWKEFKAIEMGGAIPAKYVQLISLAVSAQIPCKNCVYACTAFARAHGATDAELAEAVAVAAIVRHWSTYLNGAQIDEAKFRREADQLFRGLKAKAPKPR